MNKQVREDWHIVTSEIKTEGELWLWLLPQERITFATSARWISR